MSRCEAIRKYFMSTLLSGLLVVVPIYLALLLLLKAMNSLGSILRPITKILKLPEWLPTGELLALLVVLLVCLLVGALMRTRIGQATEGTLEQHVLKKVPGYVTIRGLTQQLLGDGKDKAWKPALAEIEEAFVPAFIIEELGEDLVTIFVPSAPTPFSGTVYVISTDRVHPVNIPIAQAIRVISQWGGGSAAFVAALERPQGTTH